MSYVTAIDLDVHARSIVAGGVAGGCTHDMPAASAVCEVARICGKLDFAFLEEWPSG